MADNGPLGDNVIEIPEGAPVDDQGNTREHYEAIRRSRVKHALSLLNGNGIKPFFLISVEDIMNLDERLDGRLAAAVLDLACIEWERPDPAEMFAPFIERTLEHAANEDPKPS